MRIHGYLSNNKNKQLKKQKRKKSVSKKNKQKDDAKKDRLANIDYLEFMSDEQITKLETSKCTKLLTGKRQRKMMKRFRHAAREKNEEVILEDKLSNAKVSGSKKEADSDVDMKET